MKIELLDYTVRASLSNRTLAADMREYEQFVRGLAASGIEHIELGYLAKDRENWFCKPLATSMEEYEVLTAGQNITYSVMLHPSGYDCGELPFCADGVQEIRVLLELGQWENAMQTVTAVRAKGYGAICDFDRIYEYSDRDILRLCEELNAVGVSQVTIVDDTKRMDGRPVQRAAMLLDGNLSSDIRIGLRSGENAGMAQFIANNFLSVPMRANRTAVLEGTLLGIGFVAGNLCTECVADQLNVDFGADYDYEQLVTLISLFIPESNAAPKDGWLGGYHPAFYLTAKHQVDGEYGRYFLSKGAMLYELDGLLKRVAETQRFELFDERIAEKIYNENRNKMYIL